MITVAVKTYKPKSKDQIKLQEIRAKARRNGTLRMMESRPVVDNRRGPQKATKEKLLHRLGLHVVEGPDA